MLCLLVVYAYLPNDVAPVNEDLVTSTLPPQKMGSYVVVNNVLPPLVIAPVVDAVPARAMLPFIDT